jgi:hypothetical protein
MVRKRGGKIGEPDDATRRSRDLSPETADLVTGSSVVEDGRVAW